MSEGWVGVGIMGDRWTREKDDHKGGRGTARQMGQGESGAIIFKQGRMVFMAFRETLWRRRVNDGLTVTWRLTRSGVYSILPSPVMQGEREISGIQK